MKITKQTILDRARQFCAENGKNYDSLMEVNGGEDGFVNKVVEIDRDATEVKTRKILSGFPYGVSPIRRAENGLVFWAPDYYYPGGHDSAEVVCRGGWLIEKRKPNEPRKTMNEKDFKSYEDMDDLPEAEYKI